METHLIGNAAVSAFVTQLVEQLKPEIAAIVHQQISEANRCGVAAAIALDYMQFSDTIACAIENDTSTRSAATALVEELVRGFLTGELSDHREFRDLEARVTDVEDFEKLIDHNDSRLDEQEAKVDHLDSRLDELNAVAYRLDSRIDELEADVDRLKMRPAEVSRAALLSALRTLLREQIA